MIVRQEAERGHYLPLRDGLGCLLHWLDVVSLEREASVEARDQGGQLRHHFYLLVDIFSILVYINQVEVLKL